MNFMVSVYRVRAVADNRNEMSGDWLSHARIDFTIRHLGEDDGVKDVEVRH